MSGGETEPTEGEGKVWTTSEDFGKGGSRLENIREILCGGGARGDSVWVQDVGNDPPLEKPLKVFHHQAVQRMAGTGPKLQRYGTWVYAPIGAALATVGIDEIGAYIALLHNMVAQYIATCTITNLCLAVERKPGLRLSRQWLEQPSLDIIEIRVGHAAS